MIVASQFDELGDEYFNISGGHIRLYYADKKQKLFVHINSKHYKLNTKSVIENVKKLNLVKMCD